MIAIQLSISYDYKYYCDFTPNITTHLLSAQTLVLIIPHLFVLL